MTSLTELLILRDNLAIELARVNALIGRELGAADTPQTDLSAESRFAAIRIVLDEAGTDMSPVEIHTEFRQRGRSDRKDFVQVATNRLFHEGQIGRVAEGRYIALGRA